SNLWIVDLDDVHNPFVVGVVSLYFGQDLPTIPISVRAHEGRAYVGNAPYRGVIVVDLQKAINESTGRLTLDESSAVTPLAGADFQAKLQSVDYSVAVGQPSSANSVDVVDQAVQSVGPNNNPTGLMPVTFAADQSQKELIAIGFPLALDGINSLPPPDKRVLSSTATFVASPLEPGPGHIRVVQGVPIQNGSQTTKADLAVLASASRLWIYDVTDPVNPVMKSDPLFTDLKLPNGASAFDAEGTLAYIGIGSQIAIVDFSDPANPKLVSTIPGLGGAVGSLAVGQGFIYTLSPTGQQSALNVSIGSPASVLFVHGQSGIADLTCANPIVVDRSTNLMEQNAEIDFVAFGRSAPTSQQVV
ncbi:MAG: hypothetical protein ACREAC_01965, partial [Blastocatellia bacterium]